MQDSREEVRAAERHLEAGFSIDACGDHPAMSGNVLVVLLEDGAETALRREVRRRGDEVRAVHVVAPAQVGAIQWLATDEDEARRQAERRALEAEWMLEGTAEVEAEAGDPDPVLAVEDSLRAFD